MRFREEVINVHIAEIIGEFKIKATPETISKHKLPDILLLYNGIKINIEGRFKKSPKSKKLVEHCVEKLELGIADIAVALYYDDEIHEAESHADLKKKIREATYDYTFIFYTEEGLSKYPIERRSLSQLVSDIGSVYNVVRNSEILRNVITTTEAALEECANDAIETNLFFDSEVVLDKLKKVLGVRTVVPPDNVQEKKKFLKTAFFILFDSLLFQEALSTTIPSITSLKQIESEDDYIMEVMAAWNEIMKIDYLPIFSLSYQLLVSLPSSVVTNDILKKLGRLAIRVLSTGIVMKHDLMGRIFHKLLLNSSGKFYATYYTSITSAWILSYLSIMTSDAPLKSVEDLSNLSIIDPACGSGTLLSSTYNALRDKYIISAAKLDLNAFHKEIIEKVLYGWDIIDYAGHLTLTSLALHNFKVTIDDSNVYTLPVGASEHGVHLGSLDYLNPKTSLFGKGFRMVPVKKGAAEKRVQEINMKSGDYDLVIMNPPFSRTAGTINTVFGYEEKKIQILMSKKLSNFADAMDFTGIGHAGLGAYFIVLGHKMVKLEGGRLAIVIPRAILSGVSWQKIRNILLNRYEIEYIVSNHDPGDEATGVDPWSFSENTSLGEVLLVAKSTESKEKYTTIVNLLIKPKNEIESLIISSESVRARKGKGNWLDKGEAEYAFYYDKQISGYAYNIQQEQLDYNFLYPVLFANPALNRLTSELLSENIIPLTYFSELGCSLGVDRKQISIGVQMAELETVHKALMSHSIDIKAIEVVEDKLDYITFIKSDSINRYAAHLLIAEHLFLNNNSMCALYSERKILSSAFWEIGVTQENAKILSLWLNSTFGFILYLANSISFGSQINLKKGQLSEMYLLDADELQERQRREIISFFDDVRTFEFQKFPAEFDLAAQGHGLRFQVDNMFKDVLNMDIDLLPYYRMLAVEPILTNERLIKKEE